MNNQNKVFKEFRDSDFTFIGVLTVLIAYLTTKLITITIKEVITLNLNTVLLIQFIIYFGVIIFILKYYHNKKYE